MFLAGTAQGKDIITEVDFFRSGIRSFTSLLALWLWAYNSMKLAQTTLELSQTYKFSGQISDISDNAILFVSGLLGLFPFISAISVISVIQESTDPIILTMLLVETWMFVVFIFIRINKPIKLGKIQITRSILNIVSLYIFKLYSLIRELINASFNVILKNNDKKNIQAKPSDLNEHLNQYMHGLQLINWTVHFSVYLLIAFWPIHFSNFFGSIGLIFIALSCFSIVGIIFTYFRKKTRVPLFPFLVLTVLVFTIVNENNKAGEIQMDIDDKRQDLTMHFEDWFENRATLKDTVQITLVAAEGGGLRSAYWTYGILRQLHLDNTGFYNQLYAISSVSGGGVGAALYCTEQFTGLSESISEAPIINDDNLSPMLGSLLFRELIQSIIPFSLEILDRSTTMNKNFENNWKTRHPNYPLWNKEFIELWNINKSLPVMLFNTTKVESGESVLFSSVSFDSAQIHSIDMMKHLSKQPKLSEVVGLSARFMYLQPAGRFDYTNGKTWGHLVDGGYYDNSGLSTIFQLYTVLREKADILVQDDIAKYAKFNIIYIRNVRHTANNPENSFINEVNTPIKTLLNSWYSRVYSFEQIVRTTLPMINQNDKFYEIKLDREELPLPLGWLFSENSKNEMVRQLEYLDKDDNYKQVNSSIAN
ncbi:MAG: hypothetical protein HN691_04485 [Bacteroidetes bacterium]|nr:hypothetical protein [Bacteroidota bacterium]MBT7994109.1 hypothetical protein [Bacteroidota bacterium]